MIISILITSVVAFCWLTVTGRGLIDITVLYLIDPCVYLTDTPIHMCDSRMHFTDVSRPRRIAYMYATYIPVGWRFAHVFDGYFRIYMFYRQRVANMLCEHTYQDRIHVTHNYSQTILRTIICTRTHYFYTIFDDIDR